MKKLLVSLVLVVLVTLNLNAQEHKWEASVNGVYGQFTNDFTQSIYDDFKGVDIEVSRLIFKEYVGVGAYYETLSSTGVPITHGYEGGYEGVDERVDIDMDTYGLELFVRPFKFVDIYTRYGVLTIKEVLDSNIGYDEFESGGNTFDLGIRFNLALSERLNLQVKGETTKMNLDVDTDGVADNWSLGLGLGYRF